MATTSSVTGLAQELIGEHAASVTRDGHHGRVARYLAGDHDLPYIPREARREYVVMARRSITNMLPRVSDTFVKLLFVDGYRVGRQVDNAAPWAFWQRNKLDARQTIAHRGAIEYGASYVLVLPGDTAPAIRPLDPLRAMAWYADEDDEWPVHGIRHRGKTSDDSVLWELITATDVHTLAAPHGGGTLKLLRTESHPLKVCPLVRFRDRLDGKPTGVIAPLIIPQDRINDTVFALTMAMHYASFRQRWATGLVVPVDEQEFLTVDNPEFDTTEPVSDDNPLTLQVPNPGYGKPIETFDAAVDRLWTTDSKDAHFGDFQQTDVTGHLDAFRSALDTMAVLGQLPSGMLKGDLVNVSAEALASLYDVTQRQAGMYETLFGEAWEQVLNLAAVADGQAVAEDAQVRWRDTEARAFTATVDALGKMVQMLGVPAEAAWEQIPGITQTDVARWRGMATANDGLAALTEALTRQSQPTTGKARDDGAARERR